MCLWFHSIEVTFSNFSPKCRYEFKQSECPTRYYCFCGKQVLHAFYFNLKNFTVSELKHQYFAFCRNCINNIHLVLSFLLRKIPLLIHGLHHIPVASLVASLSNLTAVMTACYFVTLVCCLFIITPLKLLKLWYNLCLSNFWFSG